MIGRTRTVSRSPHRLEATPCDVCGRDQGEGRAHHYRDHFELFGLSLKGYNSGTNYLCPYHSDEPVISSIEPPIAEQGSNPSADGVRDYAVDSHRTRVRAIRFKKSDRTGLLKLDEYVHRRLGHAPNGVDMTSLRDVRENARDETALVAQEVWEALCWWTVTAMKNTESLKDRSYYYDLFRRLRAAEELDHREVLDKLGRQSSPAEEIFNTESAVPMDKEL